MALSATGLADEIRIAMGFPNPVSAELVGWASGVVTEITVNGSAATGSPGPTNAVSGLSGPTLATSIVSGAGYPGTSAELLSYATAVAGYMVATAKVTYVNAPDWNAGGTISLMTGAGMAAAIAAGVGYPSVSAELLAKSTAMVDHIQTNALVNGGTIT